jgi:putative endonuclease
MFWIYILRSLKDGGYYIGQCRDLEARVERHLKGYVPSTKTRGPWELVHRESFESRREAVLRERYLKSLKSKKAIKEVVETCRGSSVGRAQD